MLPPCAMQPVQTLGDLRCVYPSQYHSDCLCACAAPRVGRKPLRKTPLPGKESSKTALPTLPAPQAIRKGSRGQRRIRSPSG